MVQAKKKKVKARKAKAKVKKGVRKPKVKARAKKVGAKKPKASKARAAKTGRSPTFGMEKIGEVTHYFGHVKAAAVLILKDGLKVGDKIYIKGHTTDFKEKVASMQLDHVAIQEGIKGQEIGLGVKSRVRIGDAVYKV